jgi:conjugal transfer mating pair stabilization protein TraN
MLRAMTGFSLLCVLLLFARGAMATPEATFEENLSWAQSVTKQTQSKPDYALDPNEYCKDAACKAQIANPDQSQMSSTDFERKAQGEYMTNESSQSINDNFANGRPDAENEAAYQFATIAIENAYEISHGLSNQFVDCEAGSLCTDIQVPKTCKKPTNNPVTCTRVPTLTDMDLHEGSTQATSVYTSLWWQWGKVFFAYPSTVTLPTEAKFLYAIEVPALMISEIKANPFVFSVNGVVVYSYRGSQGSSHDGLSFYNKKVGIITLKPPLPITNHRVSLSLKMVIHGDVWPITQWLTYQHASTLTLQWNAPEYEFEWNSSCGTLIPECAPAPETCIEGKETRDINGMDITLDCWKFETIYHCNLPDTCGGLSDCTDVSQACSLKQEGVCVETRFVKSCTEEYCQTNTLTCGETSFCLDGDCYDETPTQGEGFDEAMGAMGAVSAAGEDLGDPPLMFAGDAMQCTKKPAGMNDCCKNGGWGDDLGIMSCSPEEEALGLAKEAKITIYVGKYCAESVLGVCIRKKQTYCTYGSKLARIIQEQGAGDQLGISNGTPKDPRCDPITPEQLQKIDFSRIDFSDFYGDMHDGMNLPSPDDIQDSIQNGFGRAL